ncbi:MAG: hypothetical protein JO261_13590, partial [Alphaproteobacteria bacterium]|nr:hypothetical protein [Alphaproteobacteria bacterium]
RAYEAQNGYEDGYDQYAGGYGNGYDRYADGYGNSTDQYPDSTYDDDSYPSDDGSYAPQ